MKPFAFLEDSTGGTSSMRLMCVVIVAVVMCVWAFCCISERRMIDMPPMALGLIASALGAKILQRHVEDAGAAKTESAQEETKV